MYVKSKKTPMTIYHWFASGHIEIEAASEEGEQEEFDEMTDEERWDAGQSEWEGPEVD